MMYHCLVVVKKNSPNKKYPSAAKAASESNLKIQIFQ